MVRPAILESWGPEQMLSDKRSIEEQGTFGCKRNEAYVLGGIPLNFMLYVLAGMEVGFQLQLKRVPDSSVSIPSWLVWKGIPPPKTRFNTHGWITG